MPYFEFKIEGPLCLHSFWEFMVQTHCFFTVLHKNHPPAPKSLTPRYPAFNNKGIVSRVGSMECRMSILRLWRTTVSNLRIACVAVSNLGIWGPYIDITIHSLIADPASPHRVWRGAIRLSKMWCSVPYIT